MQSYGEAQGFTPRDEEPGSRKTKTDDFTDGLEGEQANAFDEDEDESTSDEDIPGLDQRQDEVKAFLEAYYQGPLAGETPLRAPQATVQKAISAIMDDTRIQIPRGGGVFDPLEDVDTSSGSANDRRETLRFEKKGI